MKKFLVTMLSVMLVLSCALTVAACTPVTIALSDATVEMEVGDTYDLTATVEGSEEAVSWSSSNSAVVTVTGGTITAVGSGEATVTAKIGDASKSCTVTVLAEKVTYNKTATNGTIIVTGGERVGERVTITFTPAVGYEFIGATLNGSALNTADGEYTGTAEKTMNIVANFQEQAVTVNVNTPENGTVTLDKASYNWSDDITVTVAPEANYELASLTVNGVNVTSAVVDGEYTFSASDLGVTTVNVVATFGPKSIALNVNAFENGSVTLMRGGQEIGVDDVKYGDAITVILTPVSELYKLTAFTVDETDMFAQVANGVFTFTATPDDYAYDIVIEFEQKDLAVTVAKEQSGRAITLGAVTVTADGAPVTADATNVTSVKYADITQELLDNGAFNAVYGGGNYVATIDVTVAGVSETLTANIAIDEFAAADTADAKNLVNFENYSVLDSVVGTPHSGTYSTVDEVYVVDPTLLPDGATHGAVKLTSKDGVYTLASFDLLGNKEDYTAYDKLVITMQLSGNNANLTFLGARWSELLGANKQYNRGEWIDVELDMDFFLEVFDNVKSQLTTSIDKTKGLIQVETDSTGYKSLWIYEIKAVKDETFLAGTTVLSKAENITMGNGGLATQMTAQDLTDAGITLPEGETSAIKLDLSTYTNGTHAWGKFFIDPEVSYGTLKANQKLQFTVMYTSTKATPTTQHLRYTPVGGSATEFASIPAANFNKWLTFTFNTSAINANSYGFLTQGLINVGGPRDSLAPDGIVLYIASIKLVNEMSGVTISAGTDTLFVGNEIEVTAQGLDTIGGTLTVADPDGTSVTLTDGKFTATKAGNYIATAKADGYISKSLTFTVYENLELTATAATVNGREVTLGTVTVTGGSGEVVPSYKVEYYGAGDTKIADIAVTDGKFTATYGGGKYVVTYSATKGGAQAPTKTEEVTVADIAATVNANERDIINFENYSVMDNVQFSVGKAANTTYSYLVDPAKLPEGATHGAVQFGKVNGGHSIYADLLSYNEEDYAGYDYVSFTLKVTTLNPAASSAIYPYFFAQTVTTTIEDWRNGVYPYDTWIEFNIPIENFLAKLDDMKKVNLDGSTDYRAVNTLIYMNGGWTEGTIWVYEFKAMKYVADANVKYVMDISSDAVLDKVMVANGSNEIIEAESYVTTANELPAYAKHGALKIYGTEANGYLSVYADLLGEASDYADYDQVVLTIKFNSGADFYMFANTQYVWFNGGSKTYETGKWIDVAIDIDVFLDQLANMKQVETPSADTKKTNSLLTRQQSAFGGFTLYIYEFKAVKNDAYKASTEIISFNSEESLKRVGSNNNPTLVTKTFIDSTTAGTEGLPALPEGDTGYAKFDVTMNTEKTNYLYLVMYPECSFEAFNSADYIEFVMYIPTPTSTSADPQLRYVNSDRVVKTFSTSDYDKWITVRFALSGYSVSNSFGDSITSKLDMYRDLAFRTFMIRNINSDHTIYIASVRLVSDAA